MSRKVLVVDDEKNIVDIIAFNLNREGYEVIVARDGEKALEAFEKEAPNLVILDIMMPKMDGFETCKKIRQTSNTPIIMLTARAEEVDKVLGLELGADDYVTKPFSVRELLARVKANLRKQNPNPVDSKNSNTLVYGNLTINSEMYSIKRDNQEIDLTQREFELIKFLALASPKVFSREELLEKVWGYDYLGDVRTVDVTIRRLRTKVEENPEHPKHILTRRGVGYYFAGV